MRALPELGTRSGGRIRPRAGETRDDWESLGWRGAPDECVRGYVICGQNLRLSRRYFSLTFSDKSRNSLACLWLAFICNCASCREFSVVRIGAKDSSSVATSRA
jgi:hypothetical protein